MTDEYELNRLRKNGIFIYQLPAAYIEEARDRYPHEYIYHYFYDGNGLHIYFHDQQQAEKYAHSREIVIKGRRFKISLCATSLTVHGVSAPVEKMQALLKANGYEDVVDLYQTGKKVELGTYVSFINDGDYRIILKIPELLYDYPLRDILWSEQATFKVSFFCRFCRQNGHKSCDCVEFPQSFPATYCERQSHRYFSSNSNEPNLGQFHLHSATAETISIVNYQGTAAPHCSYASDALHSRALRPEPHQDVTDKTFKDTEKRPGFEASNPPQRSVSISGGIQEAIANTLASTIVYRRRTDERSHIDSESLIIFLNHVRRRKDRKFKEITLAFTDNVPGLIELLESVEKNYYTTVATRGTSEDRDLTFLENLRKRLQNLFLASRTGLTSSDSD